MAPAENAKWHLGYFLLFIFIFKDLVNNGIFFSLYFSITVSLSYVSLQRGMKMPSFLHCSDSLRYLSFDWKDCVVVFIIIISFLKSWIKKKKKSFSGCFFCKTALGIHFSIPMAPWPDFFDHWLKSSSEEFWPCWWPNWKLLACRSSGLVGVNIFQLYP